MSSRARRTTLPLILAFLLCVGAAGPGAAQDDGLRFEGNEAIEESRLRSAASEELEDYRRMGRRRADIDDAAWRMENLYREEGYAFAQVLYRYEETGGAVTATFLIEEGPRVLLGEIAIEGSEDVPEEKLREFIITGDGGLFDDDRFYVARQFKEAAGYIRDYYYGEGYVRASVEPPRVTFSEDRVRADVTITVTEGPRHFIRQVVLAGDLYEGLGEALDALAGSFEGEVFQARRKNVLSSRIAEIYAGDGYPDVEVRVAELAGDAPGDVILEATVTSGPRVRIRDVAIRGHRKTRTGIIRKQIQVRAGEWYDWKKVTASIDGINRLGVFSSVEASAEGDGEERTLVFDLEEAPSKGVLLEVGWGSYEKARARIGYREKNLFGTALQASAIVSGSLKNRFLGARISDSTFMGTEIMANFPLEYSLREEPTFTEESLETSFVLLRKLGRRLNISGRYAFRMTNIRSIEATEPDPSLEENYNLGSVRLRIGRDTRNDLFYPSSGTEGSLSLEYASHLLGGDLSFLRYTLTSAGFLKFGPDTVLALRLETGLLMPTEDDTSVPLAERFFNGGENTVRSFTESQIGPKDAEGDPLGGLGYNVLSVELRRRLTGNLAASLFLDAGNVMPNRSRTEQGLPPFENAGDAFDSAVEDYFGDIRTGVGVGLQYLLPVGPARIDVAVNPDPRDGEDSWVAHFTLGMAF